MNYREILPQTVVKWKWYPRSGQVLFLNGKFCMSDRIQALWARFNKSSGLGHGHLASYKDRVQPYIYFSIGSKHYKTKLFR